MSWNMEPTVVARRRSTQSAKSNPRPGWRYLASSAMRDAPSPRPRPMIFSSDGVWMQYTRSVLFSGSNVDSKAGKFVSCASMRPRWRANQSATAWLFERRATHSLWHSSSRSQTSENGNGIARVGGECSTHLRASWTGWLREMASNSEAQKLDPATPPRGSGRGPFVSRCVLLVLQLMLMQAAKFRRRPVSWRSICSESG